MENNSNFESNVALAKEIINYYKENKSFKNSNYKFKRAYIHSNEGDYYKNLEMKGKDVLTVGSSCDQILYSLLYGANSVTLFDLNPFVKYVFELKSAAIQTLPITQTRSLFFLNSRIKGHNFGETIEQLSPLMSKESAAFWQTLGENFSHKEIIGGLFENFVSRYPIFLQNKNDYVSLGNILKSGPNVQFIQTTLHNLPSFLQPSNKFDLALISNVMDYYGNPNEYKEDIKQLLPHMKEDSLIQVNYSYRYSNLNNHIKFPNKLEDAKQLFGVEPINGAIYPHLRDVVPSPIRHLGSFGIPIFKENSIFIKTEDLKETFVNFEETTINTESIQEANTNELISSEETSSGAIDYFKINKQSSVEKPLTTESSTPQVIADSNEMNME